MKISCHFFLKKPYYIFVLVFNMTGLKFTGSKLIERLITRQSLNERENRFEILESPKCFSIYF